MVTKLQAAGFASTVLLAPPPVCDSARVRHQQMRSGNYGVVPEPDRSLAATGLYAAACRQVAAARAVPCVDLYCLMQVGELPGGAPRIPAAASFGPQCLSCVCLAPPCGCLGLAA